MTLSSLFDSRTSTLYFTGDNITFQADNLVSIVSYTKTVREVGTGKKIEVFIIQTENSVHHVPMTEDVVLVYS